MPSLLSAASEEGEHREMLGSAPWCIQQWLSCTEEGQAGHWAKMLQCEGSKHWDRFLVRWVVLLRSIWSMPSIMCLNFWLAVKRAGSWAQVFSWKGLSKTCSVLLKCR